MVALGQWHALVIDIDVKHQEQVRVPGIHQTGVVGHQKRPFLVIESDVGRITTLGGSSAGPV
jgi:hypothetical protein